MLRPIKIHSAWLCLLVVLMVALACSGPNEPLDTPTASAPTPKPLALSVNVADSPSVNDAVVIQQAQDPSAPATNQDVVEEAEEIYWDAPRPSVTIWNPRWRGAASPALSTRIYNSDAIVRANFVSASNGVLRFTALEYLKGSGTINATIDVRASTVGRTTTWDTREGILFLSTGTTEGARGDALTYNFAPGWSTDEYKGTLGIGYSIDKRNPVWLPSVASGEFIIEALSPSGEANPSISLADLRTAIAWQVNSNNVDEYDKCVQAALRYEQGVRDWDVFFGPPTGINVEEPFTIETTGDNAWVVHSFDNRIRTDGMYSRLWLTGTDQNHFRTRIVDDDTSHANGYFINIEASRPLPPATYQFVVNSQEAVFRPCNFSQSGGQVQWVVNVPSTEGVVHEALFDPATLTAGVGAEGTTGTLSNTSFTIGGTSTSLSGLKWADGSATLTLSRHVALTGHRLDIVEVDGTVSRSLSMSSATVNASNRTYTWSTSQPWHTGDKLMVRIMPAVQIALSVDKPTPAAGESVTISTSITNGFDGLTPSYSWELGFSGVWLQYGEGPTLKTLGNSETVGFRVTVTYANGYSVTSAPINVTWPN